MNRSVTLSLLAAFALLSAVPAEMSAQVDRTPFLGARSRFGAFAGANINMIAPGAQRLNGTILFTQPQGDVEYVDGLGYGPYGGLMYEYHNGGMLGMQIRASYDFRGGTSKDEKTNPGTSYSLTTRMAYLTVEPALRVNIFNPNLHVVAGPSISYLLTGEYDFAGGTGQSVSAGEYEAASEFSYGIWGGVGYDFLMNEVQHTDRWYLTPFVEGSWLIDQRKAVNIANDNVDDALSTISLRAGLQLKWGEAPPSGFTERVTR